MPECNSRCLDQQVYEPSSGWTFKNPHLQGLHYQLFWNESNNTRLSSTAALNLIDQHSYSSTQGEDGIGAWVRLFPCIDTLGDRTTSL